MSEESFNENQIPQLSILSKYKGAVQRNSYQMCSFFQILIIRIKQAIHGDQFPLTAFDRPLQKDFIV